MKIGELAKITGCQVGTIRFYETSGLLPAAPRTHGNYRVYGEEHKKALQFIVWEKPCLPFTGWESGK